MGGAVLSPVEPRAPSCGRGVFSPVRRLCARSAAAAAWPAAVSCCPPPSRCSGSPPASLYNHRITEVGKDLHGHPIIHLLPAFPAAPRPSVHLHVPRTPPGTVTPHSPGSPFQHLTVLRPSILLRPPHGCSEPPTAALPFALPSRLILHSQHRAVCPPDLSPSYAKSKAPPGTQSILGRHFPFSLGSSPCPDGSSTLRERCSCAALGVSQ